MSSVRTRRSTFYLDLLERTGWTFVQAFAAQMIASGLDIADPLTNMSISQKATVAAIAGLVAVFKSLIANQLPWTAANSASSLPAEVDPPAEVLALADRTPPDIEPPEQP